MPGSVGARIESVVEADGGMGLFNRTAGRWVDEQAKQTPHASMQDFVKGVAIRNNPGAGEKYAEGVWNTYKRLYGDAAPVPAAPLSPPTSPASAPTSFEQTLY
jgi:hypothetical protein